MIVTGHTIEGGIFNGVQCIIAPPPAAALTPPGVFDVDERYRAFSAADGLLERLSTVVNFEIFLAVLNAVIDASSSVVRLEQPATL